MSPAYGDVAVWIVVQALRIVDGRVRCGVLLSGFLGREAAEQTRPLPLRDVTSRGRRGGFFTRRRISPVFFCGMIRAQQRYDLTALRFLGLCRRAAGYRPGYRMALRKRLLCLPSP